MGRVALHATEEVETVDHNDFVLTAAPGDGSCSDVWRPPLANFLNTSSIFLFVRDYTTAPSSSIVVFNSFVLHFCDCFAPFSGTFAHSGCFETLC